MKSYNEYIHIVTCLLFYGCLYFVIVITLIAFVHDLLPMTTIISIMSDQLCANTIYRKLNRQDSLSLYFIMDINNRELTTGTYRLECFSFHQC